jgi:predicted MFS family arabinose efflux permease
MMTSNVAAASLGRLLGATLGGYVYASAGSFAAVGVLALVIGLAAPFVLWTFVHEHQAHA